MYSTRGIQVRVERVGNTEEVRNGTTLLARVIIQQRNISGLGMRLSHAGVFLNARFLILKTRKASTHDILAIPYTVNPQFKVV